MKAVSESITSAYGASFEKIGEIMYPKGHPYNWSVIGSLDDLQAASMEDVKGFFPPLLHALTIRSSWISAISMSASQNLGRKNILARYRMARPSHGQTRRNPSLTRRSARWSTTRWHRFRDVIWCGTA